MLFFQLLFGRVPFAADMHPELVLREGSIPQEARNLRFPESQAVSQPCKDFIQR